MDEKNGIASAEKNERVGNLTYSNFYFNLGYAGLEGKAIHLWERLEISLFPIYSLSLPACPLSQGLGCFPFCASSLQSTPLSNVIHSGGSSYPF